MGLGSSKSKRQMILDKYAGEKDIDQFLNKLSPDEIEIVTRAPIKRGFKFNVNGLCFEVKSIKNSEVHCRYMGSVKDGTYYKDSALSTDYGFIRGYKDDKVYYPPHNIVSGDCHIWIYKLGESDYLQYDRITRVIFNQHNYKRDVIKVEAFKNLRYDLGITTLNAKTL